MIKSKVKKVIFSQIDPDKRSKGRAKKILNKKNIKVHYGLLKNEVKNFIIGVEMTLEQLKQVFNNHNIVRIDPIGEKFDYNIHQAMFEKETDEVEQGTIIEVMQPGWALHDRLLRPAMVGVSKKKIKQ